MRTGSPELSSLQTRQLLMWAACNARASSDQQLREHLKQNAGRWGTETERGGREKESASSLLEETANTCFDAKIVRAISQGEGHQNQMSSRLWTQNSQRLQSLHWACARLCWHQSAADGAHRRGLPLSAGPLAIGGSWGKGSHCFWLWTLLLSPPGSKWSHTYGPG